MDLFEEAGGHVHAELARGKVYYRPGDHGASFWRRRREWAHWRRDNSWIQAARQLLRLLPCAGSVEPPDRRVGSDVSYGVVSTTGSSCTGYWRSSDDARYFPMESSSMQPSSSCSNGCSSASNVSPVSSDLASLGVEGVWPSVGDSAKRNSGHDNASGPSPSSLWRKSWILSTVSSGSSSSETKWRRSLMEYS